MATKTLDKPQTRADWKARYLDHYYGQVSSITPENGLMRITVSNHLGSMDFHADPRSRFVKMAQALLPKQGKGWYNDCRIPAVLDVIYRKSSRWGNDNRSEVACFQIVAMEEAQR